MRILVSIAALTALALTGCKPERMGRSVTDHSPMDNGVVTGAPSTPPSVPPARFKLFHKTDNSLTLVTSENASDDAITALIYELRDAAKAHSFDSVGLPQAFIDKRDPMIWFHIYRGEKCASEKYTTKKLPCGAAYHAAGDYTLGGFADKNHDTGTLIHDENHETKLW